MPVYSLKTSSVAPWLEMELLLEAHPDGEEKFRRFQGRTHAIIIAWWGDPLSSCPTHYMVGFSDLYNWPRFGDQTRSENPKQYRRLKKTMEVLERLRQEYPEERIGLVLWAHPDTDYTPVEEYILLTGSQFPGSPRQ